MVEEEYEEVTKHANGSKTRKKKYRQHFGRHDFFKEEVRFLNTRPRPLPRAYTYLLT